MAKGNMLLGYSTGSVGDVTFARVKGQQTQRARNRNPNNPKSPAQMYQRAKLAAAVNFFKAASSKFFKFAFEDRGAHESDYNAFMRHNMSRTMPMPKKYNDNGYVPITPFVLSQGSLSGITGTPQTLDYEIAQLELPFTLTAQDIASSTTVGKLTDILKRNIPGVQSGDIITVMTVLAENDTNVADFDYPLDESLGEYYVILEQVILKDGDGEIVPTAFQQKKSGVNAGDPVTITPSPPTGYKAVGMAVVHSRQTASGLLVSNTELIMCEIFNTSYNDNFVTSQVGPYRDYLMTSWGASQESILQGSLYKE